MRSPYAVLGPGTEGKILKELGIMFVEGSRGKKRNREERWS